jgi:RecA/RadA recombinase
MAKKKKKALEKNIDLAALFNDEFGANVIVEANTIMDNPVMTIPFSPAHDLSLGGGIREGSFVIMTGAPKIGKTSSALHFAANAQKPENDSPKHGPRKVYFVSVEGRLQPRDMEGIPHLNTDSSRFMVIKSCEEKILYAEDFLKMAEAIVHTQPGSVVIFDSFSQLCSKMRHESEIGDRVRDDIPLILASFCKRLCNVLRVNDVIFIGITHKIANQNPASRKQTTESGGNKIQYDSDVKLTAMYKEDVRDGEEGSCLGQIIHWKCDWTSSGAPGGTSESLLRFGYGLDKEWEIIKLCKTLGIISGSTWLEFPDGTKKQGVDNASEYLRENPDVYDILQGECKEMMGL